MHRFAEALQGVVAIDGKTLRRSFDRAAGKSPLHVLHAWSADQRRRLGQLAVDGKMNKDQARNHKDHGPQNMALLRRLALNLAKLEGSREALKGKLYRAALSDVLLQHLLASSAKLKCDSPAISPMPTPRAALPRTCYNVSGQR